MLRSILTSRGIALRSVTEKIDDTAEGKLMEGVLAVLAQFDNDKRSDRTKAGMEAVVACGGYPFRSPVGYTPAEKPFGGRTLPILKPDPSALPSSGELSSWLRMACRRPKRCAR
jgi:DNA invertase Pin-like site-specific DNA recombinase